jgi:hypothetical protein
VRLTVLSDTFTSTSFRSPLFSPVTTNTEMTSLRPLKSAFLFFSFFLSCRLWLSAFCLSLFQRRYGIDGTEIIAWDAWTDTRRLRPSDLTVTIARLLTRNHFFGIYVSVFVSGFINTCILCYAQSRNRSVHYLQGCLCSLFKSITICYTHRFRSRPPIRGRILLKSHPCPRPRKARACSCRPNVVSVGLDSCDSGGID